MREAPTRLRCERMDNPLGLEESSPRLSWWVNDPRPAELQTAYQIQAARTLESLQRGDATLWDSGRIGSSRTTDVVWGGGALRSRDRVWWRVRCYDSDGLASPWSEPACFETGLLLSTDWRGRWISTPLCGSPVTPAPVPRLWRDFELSEAPAWARLYVAVLGEAVIHVNGSALGEREPIAPWSDYQRRVPYAVHDVGRLLRPGPNRIAVLLADGQFSGALAGGRRQRYGQRPAICLQLECGPPGTTAGSMQGRETVISDLGWQWRPSWLLRAERDGGEEADGRQWLPDWSLWSAGDQGFPVEDAAFAPLRRYHPSWPGVRVLAEHTPAQHMVVEPDPDAAAVRAAVDFGRALLGRVRVRLQARPGVMVTVQYLSDDDDVVGIDRYTARGHGAEWFEPLFCLHHFRRVEVLADAADAAIETVLAREVGIDGVPAGSFDCDHAPLLARYDHAARLARMALALGPVAGPQVRGRSARSTDVQAVLAGASGSLDVGPLFAGWLGGLAELQQQRGYLPAAQPDFAEPCADGAGMGAWLACLWQLYRRTGDRRVLERSLPLVRRQLEESPSASPAGEGSTRAELLESLWFVFRCMVAARIAGVLGRQRDLSEFHQRYVEARQAFRERFVTPAGLLAADDQLAYLLAIVTAVVEGDARVAAVDHIAEQLLQDGLRPRVADRYLSLLLEVLTLEGRLAVAYGLASALPPAGSLAGTCTADWLQRFVLGLELDADLSPEANAYRRVRVQPHPPPDGAIGGALQRVRGHLDTEHGRYRCAWEIVGGEFRLHLLVPANCAARVLMPDHTSHQLAGGEHELQCAWPEPASQAVPAESAPAHYAGVG